MTSKPIGPPQEISFTDAAAVQSAAIAADEVLIVPSENVYYAFGADPTATNDGASYFIPGGGIWPLRLDKQGLKLSFIAPSGGTAGKVYVTPLG